MNKQAWTAEPWIPNRFNMDSPLTVISEKGEWVCRVSSDLNWANQSAEQEFANARLIAAAPELLESLKDVVPYAEAYYRGLPDDGPEQDYVRPIINKAIAAIARAEGEEDED